MNVREEKTNLDFLKENLDRNIDVQGTSSEASDGKNLILDPAGNVESESLNSLSCLTLCDPMDCGLPGFSIHLIFQARTLEWVAISFSRRSSQPRD